MDIDIQQERITLGDEYAASIERGSNVCRSARFPRIRSMIRPGSCHRRSPAYHTPKVRVLPGIVRYYHSRRFIRCIVCCLVLAKHFRCTPGENIFDIYGHSDRKFCVYRKGVQVAYRERNGITWSKGDNYKIVINKGAFYELVIAFCLIIDNYSNNSSRSNLLTINFGSLMPGVKPFDTSWRRLRNFSGARCVV